MAKQKMIDLLYELMINSKRSDRELAKAIKVSQPTITRMRKSLEKLGYVREYTIIPNLEKIGFEIVALNFLATNINLEQAKEVQNWILKNPKILFTTSGEGLGGKTLLLVSIHKDFTDFSAFSRELKGLLSPKATSAESFLFSLKTDVVKHFSFKNLERL
ncbi:MAG: Lrp/AsnC family transcriptional regulator [Candidatus Bathyarchaeia archaeon]